MKENLMGANVENAPLLKGEQKNAALVDSKLTDAVIEIRDLLVDFKKDYQQKQTESTLN